MFPSTSPSSWSAGRGKRRLIRKGRRPSSLQWQWRVLASLAALVSLWLLFLLRIHLKPSTPASDDPFPCQAVYFWGGGKAGSTTLASLIKHDYENNGYDPNSEFIDSPKEICWAERVPMLQQRRGFGSGVDGLSKWRGMTHGHKCHPGFKHFVLDACPRYNTRDHAKLIMEENPNAKFLMLIRNPVDRLISHINDVRRGPAVDVEEAVRKLLERNLARRADAAAWNRGDAESSGILRRKGLGRQGMDLLPQKLGHVSRVSRSHWELSLYGKNLHNLLAAVPASQVLVVQTEALSRDPQQTIDDIMQFIGASKPKSVMTLRENQLQNRTSYKTISPGLRQELETAFGADQVLLLQQLGGKNFPWSWIDDGTNASNDDNWLTATPVTPAPDNRVV
jgi:hypothetical protein